ncbi:sensor histidine kinase [Solimonas sp. K1W22B-7]|uniref:sensor histidine kinase n=1 Tax=Solimonas sp. K1W22B-7 TaxID=2303331 RepID=UPI000E330630|nr:HAMP domain-containing sensor histidine kinase [Solimonas sp. K1W22B-7]AXQ27360.1 sensor histidine kinase [Solimonas sp. K1W22B-7]
MRPPLPRTMTVLVTTGCVLVSLPLLLALVLADLALQRHARQADRLMQESMALALLGSDLRDNLSQLERNARQYVALGEPALLDLFASRLKDIDTTLDRLERQQLRRDGGERLGVSLARLRQGLAEVSQAWSRSLSADAPLAEVVTRLHSLSFDIDPVVAEARYLADQRIGQLRHDAVSARRTMLLLALALVPLTALLAVCFSIAVSRPLKRMAQGVAELGHSRYQQPIAVGFPQELQELAERLDWLRLRLAQLAADKDRFLRHVSHELKTPLASLGEGAALLREGSLGELSQSQTEVAQILIESSADLEVLIDNLLAYSAWRNDRVDASMEWFDTAPLLAEVLAAHRLPLARRALDAAVEVSSPRLYGQRAQLRTALDNLMTNAIKHAPEGSTIDIAAGMNAGRCELQVRDRGRGVLDEEKQKIFEPFVRGGESEESGIRGTGVGLSIVRETAQAHSGSVEVADAGPGARFSMVWPAPAA